MADTKEITETEAPILVTLVPNQLVDDNPYNSRQVYSEDEVKSMAESIKQNGLLEAPEGRRTADGRVQIAFGHKRLRAYRSIAASVSAEKWKRFPIFIVELTDEQMLNKAIEENLQRSEVSPIEVARAIARFSEAHPDIKDKDIAKKHGMSDGQISNMKRVLRLPQRFLDMIDAGILSFTQGRELLTLEGLPNPEEAMASALTIMVSNVYPDTVEGLKRAIQQVKPREDKAPVVQDRLPKDKPSTTSPEPGSENALEVHTQEIGQAEAKPNAQAEAAKPKNISQEKSDDTKQAAVAAVLSGAAAGPEPRDEKKTEAAHAKTRRSILLEENGKGVNISFLTEKGGLVIRGVLGTLESVFPQLSGILAEMTSETNPGRKK